MLTCQPSSPFRRQPFLRNSEGSILVEFAAVLPVLIIILIGLVEIANYMRYKEKVTRAANDVTDLLATMPYWYDQAGNPAALVGESMNRAADIVRPYGVQISVTFCPAIANTILTGAPTTINQSYAAGANTECTPGGGAGSFCDANLVGANSTLPYVVVNASCQYSGMFQNFIPDIVIQSTKGSSLRYIRSFL